jgi:hypothetical protein
MPSGLTPLELLTKSKADHCDLLHSHVWGCPDIVLEPKFQNDQKLPKCNCHACVGKFLGYLDAHALLVANVQHMSIGYVCPQFCVIFDDLFEIVIQNGDNDAVVNRILQWSFQ